MTTTKYFQVNIVTPDETVNIQQAKYVCIATEDGQECFLADHQDDSYILSTGMCQIQVDEDDEYPRKYHLGLGHVLFENNMLTIVTQYAINHASAGFKETIFREQLTHPAKTTFANTLEAIYRSIESD